MKKEELMMSKDIMEIVNYINKNKSETVLINKKIQFFFKEYNNYYTDQRIKNKITFYKKSIEGAEKINVIKNENTRLKRFNKVINIYYSDLDLYKKIEKITDIFENHIDLWSNYYDLVIPLINTKLIKDLNRIFVLLKNNKEIVEFVRYYSDNVKKYKNLEYAKFIIETYMSKDDEIDLETYLYNMGIDEKVFDYCVDTICEFDIELYNKYIKVRKINDAIDLNNNRKKIIDISKEIKKGFNNGKCSYPLSEFFKNIPFKYEKSFSNILLYFVKENEPSDYNAIHDYIYINKLYKKDCNKALKIDELFERYMYVNDISVEKDTIKKVLTYMQDNNYPMINAVFYNLLIKTVNNELILTEIKDIKKRKTLIP